MPDVAEVLMIRAAFKVIDDDPRVQAKYPVRRILEVQKRFNSSDVGFLAVTGVPVRPQDLPTNSEDIYVDIYIQPVLKTEETTHNSALELNSEFNEFRKLLHSNLPLMNPDGTGASVSDPSVDLEFRGVDFSSPGIRIPIFVARYSEKINPKTGDRVA